MRRKDLERIRKLSRRRTLQGMGAVLGTTAIGCGDDSTDDGAGTGDGSSGDSGATTTSSGGSSGNGSSSGNATTGMGTGDETGGSTGGGAQCGPDAGNLTPAELLAEIDHIVVVMMENRSFDHYFGSAQFQESWAIDGLAGTESNPDLAGNDVPVFRLDNLQPEDPPHSWDPSHAQWNNGANDGFVREHEMGAPASAAEVMGYHERDQLPVLYALADNYTLFDQWYASVMGGTWPNRFYMHAATANGMMSNGPVLGLTTIWDQLEAAGVSHTNYFSDVPWVFGAFLNPLLGYTAGIDEFFTAAQAGTLPSFSIIDPNYGLLGAGGNDDHPSHDISLGQMLLGSIYNAIAQGPSWERTLLIITYDEHGGFYDHVPPPTQTEDQRLEFRQLGFRVPSLAIGPHVRQGCVDSTLLDHVSIPATATNRFGLPPLNDRLTATNDVSSAINPDFLGNPQPPATIPQVIVSVRDALRPCDTSQHELAAMINSGTIKVPAHLRTPTQVRNHVLGLLERAERLGAVKLID